MIGGLGNDIIEIDRIEGVIARRGERFLHRVYTERELAYCQQHADPAVRFAGRFAAKEAVVKALGSGLRRGLRWTDIEILNNSEGKPELIMTPDLQKIFGKFSILLSISHCKTYATAVALYLPQ